MKNSVRDYREHVFTATGKNTDLDQFTVLDAYDNLLPELEKLRCLAALLDHPDELGSGELGGIALLLKDIQRRMSAILEVLVTSRRKKS